jgi:hypothetical protein
MLSEHTKPVAAQSKAGMIAHQHALAAAIGRVKALAEKERRDPTDGEIAEIEALEAALAMLTRGINRANDGVAPAAADTAAIIPDMRWRGGRRPAAAIIGY